MSPSEDLLSFMICILKYTLPLKADYLGKVRSLNVLDLLKDNIWSLKMHLYFFFVNRVTEVNPFRI